MGFRSLSRARLVAMLVACLGAVSLALAGCGGASTSQDRAVTATRESDDDQIRDVMYAFIDAQNSGDFNGYAAHICDEFRTKLTKDRFDALRSESGRVDISIDAIDVSGGTATLDYTATYEHGGDEPEPETAEFVKEDGDWKMCFS
ncbi:MAG: nuclear transport factor 2 family protein [Phycisphaerae bacterium]|nr:nuclear transport factor 2 family protein [Phycisphaerae bacterium]